MRRQERDWEVLVTCPHCGEEEGVLVAVEPGAPGEPADGWAGVVAVSCGCALTEREIDAACDAAFAQVEEALRLEAADSWQ